ncbi:VOC family protein [Nocardia brasiliensis]|uniref:VOC family protein n=1 Tax=Nocardia brasiliensis TaxID=37326 RepID=UPI003672AEE6
MRIREVAITTTHLDAVAEFYRDTLQLPVMVEPDRATVEIGLSKLVVTRGAPHEGGHHLAFDISPNDFDRARHWLSERVEPLTVNGSDTIDGPPGWDSRSVYFRGPDNILLELIARQFHSAAPATPSDPPRLLSISEVGIAVPDVQQAVRDLAETYGLQAFTPQLPTFTPVGDHDGLLILVAPERIWFPTEADRPAHAPVTVHIDAPQRGGKVALTANAGIEG